MIAFTKKAMTSWRTRMCLHAENEVIETEDIKIQCGVFQRDSLSPLLFCICLIPLMQQLNRVNTGYEEHVTKTKILHLLYMDDLKLIAETESEIVAAQGQALNTKYYATKILHTEMDSKCRLCQQHDETIDHIISACPILAKNSM